MAKARRNTYHFHRTINVPPDLLSQYETRAMTQDNFVFNLFTTVGDDLILADVRHILRELNVPIAPSSVPRALSNLCRDGKLILTDESREGEWGVPNHIYRIKK